MNTHDAAGLGTCSNNRLHKYPPGTVTTSMRMHVCEEESDIVGALGPGATRDAAQGNVMPQPIPDIPVALEDLAAERPAGVANAEQAVFTELGSIRNVLSVRLILEAQLDGDTNFAPPPLRVRLPLGSLSGLQDIALRN